MNSCQENGNMKSLRFVLSVVLLSLSTVAFAQSDAQKSFDKLKTLAGSWEGQVTTVPPPPKWTEAHAGDAARDLHGATR